MAPAKYLAILLLIAVYLRHNTSYWISDLSGMSPRGVFYVLGGLWEALLAGVIVVLAYQKKSAWWHLLAFACFIAIIEGLQMSACRIIGNSGPRNICDSVSGLPIGATLTSLYTFNVCYFSGVDVMKLPMLLVPLIAAAEVAYLVGPVWGLGVLATCFAIRGVRGRAL